MYAELTIQRHSFSVKNVQRLATKRVHEIYDLSYEERLKYLDLPILNDIDGYAETLSSCKIVHNGNCIDPSAFFSYLKYYIHQRLKIYIAKRVTNIRLYLFIELSNPVAKLVLKLTIQILLTI